MWAFLYLDKIELACIIRKMNINDYIEMFEDLSPDMVYEILLNIGSEKSKREVERSSDNFVYGCQSNVWVEGTETPLGWEFYIDSDSYLVRGAGTIICQCMSGLTAEELDNVNWLDFDPLAKYLSQQRKQGMQAIINKCRQISKTTTNN